VRCQRFHAVMLSLVLFGLVVVPGASAAARLISPAPGAVTNSHPVFMWELGAGESSNALYVARGPETTPQGAFHPNNGVRAELFFDGTLGAWSPELGLFAGSYWWNVRTHDPELRLAYSGISSFTVAPALRLLGVRIRRVRLRDRWGTLIRQLDLDIRWVTNLRHVRIETRVLRGRRPVGRVYRLPSRIRSSPGEPDVELFGWEPPRLIRAGTRVRLIVTVSGSGKKATLTRLVRAP
jgi:hypothetical protein